MTKDDFLELIQEHKDYGGYVHQDTLAERLEELFAAGASERADAEKDAALTILRSVLEDLLGDVVDYANSQMFKDRESKWRSELIQKVSAILAANKEPQP